MLDSQKGLILKTKSNFNWSCLKKDVKYHFVTLNSVLTPINSIFALMVGVIAVERNINYQLLFCNPFIFFLKLLNMPPQNFGYHFDTSYVTFIEAVMRMTPDSNSHWSCSKAP